MGFKPVRKAVLPVAGLGTRVLPATKVIPKEMLPVFDRPALHYVIDEAREAGIEHFIFVTGRNKGAIEDYFDTAYELEATLEAKGKTALLDELRADLPAAGACSFVRQQAPLGLGHAVWCARELVGDEPFAVMLPDMIMRSRPSCLADMVSAYTEAGGGNLISVQDVPRSQVSNYGIIDPGARKGRLVEMRGMVEKPAVQDAPSTLMISGRYILQPEIFGLLSRQTPGAGGEIQLTDAMQALMASSAFHALPFEGEIFDTGSKTGYLQAAAAMALADPEHGEQAREILRALLDQSGG
ncbi:UTP--glucose-1-phosphate uridylyltransferase GalU [Alkalicaulis satelles]|uniref:UTP--glucose-1-phosphate uridylyltransferase n=1 Tax=Alkalicaulis satelles TaxID=2609175 RepID=A0A5M6ZEV3_9PROT|nr:UTP--glucose-1-phosphate uridylyltransferase GalU [Alkalicaulis satelles]KAA5802404.1 UTP--glucose-1-phosphate uridylyltransferase GalU [Alkalicaulis satelles]